MRKKKNEPIYQEMRSLSPYFLLISGVYLAVTVVLCFALDFDYSLPLGAIYGTITAALNFLLLGKTAQKALRKRNEKAVNTYMSTMYAVRYLGLFFVLTLGAIAPFISLITAIIPLFFPKFAILIRTFIRKEE
ncbi:MAG: ATP synthase subunit I [Oscillospiraceae bacterium]